ncbi:MULTISPECIES: DUF1648 domain-containing protein [Weeksella]|uniref:DUF1648 domain-containing protein n=1 Tax=Weeksella TaxID=1013 RepID=UPI0008A636D0|nr:MULTISPECIES: DUF1648 domain-containing protein [Weeksella]MDK7375112.1 DUF1648 domain-containing protein [Weeksella virosa]OFM85354.1 hypothetical protein HMPREF2660_07280 [Weeksella sp. HMSC059D05]
MKQLKKTYYDFLIEIITYIVIIVSVVFLFINYQQLPTTIPIHFNARGEVDGVGEKYTLYILVLIQIILFIGLNFLSKKPHLYNYPVPITDDNKAQQYQLASRFIRVLNLFISFIFFLLIYETISVALEKSNGLGEWFLPLFLGLTFVPTLVYLVRASKIK